LGSPPPACSRRLVPALRNGSQVRWCLGVRALLALWGLIPLSGAAEPLYVAVASNFLNPLQALAAQFERETGAAVRISAGSTGKLYAQILNGAPFDVFLAADSRRPRLLEEGGNAVPGSRFTYAEGRLVLWSRDANRITGPESLARDDYRHLAIANPKTAPYGEAARQVLERLQLWDRLRARLVFGENIGQTFQFVVSGNAELGLVALAQLHREPYRTSGSRFVIPPDWHAPIRQDAVVVAGPRERLAREFTAFLRSPEARQVLEAYGYTVGSNP
jgi:molybdate transport system substrate-binding protein